MLIDGCVANIALLHFSDYSVGNYECGKWLKGLGIKDLDQDTRPGSSVGLPHNVLNVFFDRLLGDLKRISNFLVCPPFSQVLDHRLFAVCKRKLFLGLVGIQLLPAT